MTTPPSDGSTPWGDTLNAYLSTLQAEADTNQTNIANHVSAAPAGTSLSDPHGDRAYAQQLMAPIQQLINEALGFVQLDVLKVLPGDDWRDLRPCSGHFEPPTDNDHYPPQCRKRVDGRVELAGHVVITELVYNDVTIFPGVLPPDFRPSKTVTIPVTISVGGTGSLTITPDGFMSFTGLPGGLAPGTIIGIYGSYPLDAHYHLIQD